MPKAKTRRRARGLAKQSRATPENPTFDINSPDAWDLFAGGSRSHAGVNVNYESALTYSPYWRGINLISRDVGKLPLVVYRRVGPGKDRDPSHPIYRLLTKQPNREMTRLVFWQTLMAHALNDGNGIAYVSRRGDGTPDELIPLLPYGSDGKTMSTYPVRVNGRLWYVTSVGSEQRRIPAEDVIHIKGLGFDGLTGYPVWKKGRHSLGLGMGAEEFGSRYFGNNAEPRVVIEHPGKLGEQAAKNLRNSWNAMHAGLENSHKTAILEEGMKVNAFSSNARQSQLEETRAFQIKEVANWLNLPPHKLGDDSRTSFASLEQENQSYLDDALDPWLVAIELELWTKLLTEEEKNSDTHTIEFLREALVRADLAAKTAYFRAALGGRPWETQNEVRAKMNLNPLPGGDVILEPLNMGQGGADNQPADVKPDPEAARAVRDVLHDAVARMVKRLEVHSKKAGNGNRFQEWIEKEMRQEHAGAVTSTLSPAVAAFRAVFRRGFAPEAAAEMLFSLFTQAARDKVILAHLEDTIADQFAAEMLKQGA